MSEAVVLRQKDSHIHVRKELLTQVQASKGVGHDWCMKQIGRWTATGRYGTAGLSLVWQPDSKVLYHLIVGRERKNKVMDKDYRVAKSGATLLHLNKRPVRSTSE